MRGKCYARGMKSTLQLESSRATRLEGAAWVTQSSPALLLASTSGNPSDALIKVLLTRTQVLCSYDST